MFGDKMVVLSFGHNYSLGLKLSMKKKTPEGHLQNPFPQIPIISVYPQHKCGFVNLKMSSSGRRALGRQLVTYVRAQGCSLVRRLEDVDHHPADKDMHMQLQISSGYYLQGTHTGHTGHHPSILFMKFHIVWLSIKWKVLKCLAARCLDSVN